MRLTKILLATCLVALSVAAQARAQFDFALDPYGYSPGARAGGFGYSGFGYSAYGPRGDGYYVGLPDFSTNNGPSGAYSPIFNSMAAAPRDNVQLGPTYGGYESTLRRYGNRRQPDAASLGQEFGITPGYGQPPHPGGSEGYRSAYVPPASANRDSAASAPGFTYGYGQPPSPPRGFLRSIFGRR